MIKHFIFRLKIILAIFISVVSVSCGHAADTQICLGYSDAEAFPFQIRHDADPPGIAIEILNRVGKDLGINIIYLRLPNKRVQALLSKGRSIDGAFMYSFKTDRNINARYPMKDDAPDGEKRLTSLSYYVYRLKSTSLQWDGSRLSGIDFSDKSMKIGANSGYSIVGDLEKMGVNVDDGGKTTESNFDKLISGRIVGYAHQDLVADNYIKAQKLVTVEKLAIPLVSKPYFLIFSQKFMQEHPLLAERIWQRIADIRDMVTQEVLHKYSE